MRFLIFKEQQGHENNNIPVTITSYNLEAMEIFYQCSFSLKCNILSFELDDGSPLTRFLEYSIIML